MSRWEARYKLYAGMSENMKQGSLQAGHVEAIQRAHARLASQFPRAGLILQLGSRFYERQDGNLQEVAWPFATPPPVVTRIFAVHLPPYGEALPLLPSSLCDTDAAAGC